MAHNKHTIDGINKDLVLRNKEQWLEITKDWEDPYGMPVVTEHAGIKVVRDDHMVGSKCRFADLLMQRTTEDTVGYVQPRFGLRRYPTIRLSVLRGAPSLNSAG